MKLPEFGLNFEHYMVQDLSLFHLVKQEFIEAFIKRGKLYLMSEGTKADLDNCLLVLPTNELIVYLGKDTYQELGIQGQPIVGKSKDIQTFVIRINLTAESFIPGKRNYDRVLERFNLYSHLRFNCLVAWEPNNDSICSSSIAAYFEKQLHLNVRLGKFNEKRKTNISYTIPLIQPFELGNFEDVFDWIGLITNDFDNSSADNFITEFLPEMPVCKEKKVDCIHWRGFFTRGLLQSLFEILRPAISGLSWIAIAIHGFDDIPVSKVLKKGCNYKEDERNLVCFIMFADGHHWKFFSTGRQKML